MTGWGAEGKGERACSFGTDKQIVPNIVYTRLYKANTYSRMQNCISNTRIICACNIYARYRISQIPFYHTNTLTNLRRKMYALISLGELI